MATAEKKAGEPQGGACGKGHCGRGAGGGERRVSRAEEAATKGGSMPVVAEAAGGMRTISSCGGGEGTVRG